MRAQLKRARSKQDLEALIGYSHGESTSEPGVAGQPAVEF